MGAKAIEKSVANAYAGNVHEESLIAHGRVFLQRIRSRVRPPADVEVGHFSTLPGHLMDIAWRVGRTILWDAETEMIPGDPEANALLTKAYRAPWKLDI